MEPDRPKLRSEALPRKLAEIFRMLRVGRHVCVEDGASYRVLEQEEDRYRTVLEGLGYELVHHAQGFYYLKGGRSFSPRGLQSITLFVFLLFQHLEDNKQGEPDHTWIRSLTARRFVVDELPHFGTGQQRTMMASLDITRETVHQRVLRVLQQLGMLEFSDERSFRFRSPIYRFVDLCMDFADGSWDQPTPDDEDDGDGPAHTEAKEGDASTTHSSNSTPQLGAGENEDTPEESHT